MVLWFPHGDMCIRNMPSIRTPSATYWVGWTLLAFEYLLSLNCVMLDFCPFCGNSSLSTRELGSSVYFSKVFSICHPVLQAIAILVFQHSVWSFLSFTTSETLLANGLRSKNVQSLFWRLGTCTLGACRMLYSANLSNSSDQWNGRSWGLLPHQEIHLFLRICVL